MSAVAGLPWIIFSWTALPTTILVTGNTGNTGSTGTTTYTGVVTGSGVNVRSGAGTSYPVVGSKTMGDVVTITETVSADGMIWGKIDIGWISMNYVRMN